MQYVKGNIVDIFAAGNNIIHGCNCFHTMGAGVAGALASKFPGVLANDELTIYGAKSKLGSYSEYWETHLGQDHVCINLYTQHNPGKDLSYQALADGFTLLNEVYAGETFYIPRIGAGIAGGDWAAIEVIIKMTTPDLKIIVVDLPTR